MTDALNDKNLVDPTTEEVESTNFIENFIIEDIGEGGQYEGMQVHTRFPPEPNGYLHIGHAKAICINFGMAKRFDGLCNLRMDDTNPVKEDDHFVRQIQEDIHWLGFDWGDRFYHASDYFDAMYDFAVELIEKGLAYVDEQSAEEIRQNREVLSPHRARILLIATDPRKKAWTSSLV
jgi:glutaminyl-tRNA synthetase